MTVIVIIFELAGIFRTIVKFESAVTVALAISEFSVVDVSIGKDHDAPSVRITVAYASLVTRPVAKGERLCLLSRGNWRLGLFR